MSLSLLESSNRCRSCVYKLENHINGKCLYGPTRFSTWRCDRPDCKVSARGKNGERVDTGMFQYYHRVMKGPEGKYYHVACADELGLTALCVLFLEPKL
jgi:hypothetical protein